MDRKARKLKNKKQRLGCEVCNFKIIYALHQHHCTPKLQRNGQKTDKIILCANCHNILHHEIGWGLDFSQILTKEQTKDIIYRCYRENGTDDPVYPK